MKNLIPILSLVFLFSCKNSNNEASKTDVQDSAKNKASEATNGASNTDGAASNSTAKKYDIKSGIITYDTKMEMGSMTIKTKKVLYFDDYGNKESEETYKTDAKGKEELTERSFVKDGFRYTCSIENKGGAKTKAMGTGVAAKFDMKEAEMVKDGKYKAVGDETICGKTCNGYSMETPSGTIKMYGWHHVNLKMTLDNAKMKMKSSSVATKFEENVVIPADKFEVPVGVKMTDM